MDEDIFSTPDVPKLRIGISGKASSPAPHSEPLISSAKSDTGSRAACTNVDCEISQKECPTENPIGNARPAIKSVMQQHTSDQCEASIEHEDPRPYSEPTQEVDSESRAVVDSEQKRLGAENEPERGITMHSEPEIQDVKNEPEASTGRIEKHDSLDKGKDNSRTNSNPIKQQAPRQKPQDCAVIVSKVWSYGRNGGRREPYFVIPKRDVEEQTGVRLEKKETYELDGKVKGIFEFRLKRSISGSRYIRIYIPKIHSNKVRLGEAYHISIAQVTKIDGAGNESRSSLHIDEVEPKRGSPEDFSEFLREHPASIMTKAYRNSDARIVFFFSKLWIERETRISFEQGKTYDIKGRIIREFKTIHEFKTWHSETGYNNQFAIRFGKDLAKLFIPGERYTVLFESIEARKDESANHNSKEKNEWDWKLTAAWIDTEGTYYGGPGTAFRAVINQKEKEPLEGIRDFLESDGTRSTIYNTRSGNYALRTLGGAEALAKIVLNTEPYIMTKAKKEQIAKFKAEICRRVNHENYRRKRARKILGLELNDP